MRRAATEALGNIGPAAQDAVPALIATLKDHDAEVRRGATEALEKINPAAAHAARANYG